MSAQLKYNVLRVISRLLCRLSHDHLIAIGRFLGPLIMNRIKKQRRRGIDQIMTGMECSRDEAERILQRVYQNIGMSALEMLYMPRLVKEKERIGEYVRIANPEYLEAAYAEGRGIVGLTAHMGNWEWLGAGLALHDYPTSAIGKNQKDAALMKMINEYRAEAGQHIYLTGTGGYEMIAAARSMKKNYILGFLSDKDGGKSGVPVMFMNRIFSFPQGPAVFAKKFKAPILPIFITRDEDGRHTIRMGKPFHFEPMDDPIEEIVHNSQKMASVMEDFIKQYPYDWIWFQHLFWTEPEKIKMLKEIRKKKERTYEYE